MPLPFTYGEGVILGRQLRTLCLETEMEKGKKKVALACPGLVPLARGTE